MYCYNEWAIYIMGIRLYTVEYRLKRLPILCWTAKDSFYPVKFSPSGHTLITAFLIMLTKFTGCAHQQAPPDILVNI